MKLVCAFFLLFILFVLTGLASASAIQINNLGEDDWSFLTTVNGSVGSSSQIHTLVDIPNTPWVNNSTIVETNGPAGAADSLSVTWTSNHIVGPPPGVLHPGVDVDPNPNGPVTLSLSFTPTAAGHFQASYGIDPTDPLQTDLIIEHPAAGGPHFDMFQIRFVIDVSGTLLGGFDIDAYYIGYKAEHCLIAQTVPPAFPELCANPFPLPPPEMPPLLVFGEDCGPADQFCSVVFGSAPEPGTLALLFAGAVSLWAVARKRRRGHAR